MVREIKGWHVLATFVGAFSVIIAVNLTLAFNAVATFPGLEVKNSYVASQAFDRNRAAQEALNWDVSADVIGDTLLLHILSDGAPVMVDVERATFGRATHVGEDQELMLDFDGASYVAPVVADAGNWNLRVVAIAADGTVFQQRIPVRVVR